jgi:hypothetical protein
LLTYWRQTVCYIVLCQRQGFLKKVNRKLPDDAARSFWNSCTHLISMNYSFDLSAVFSIASITIFISHVWSTKLLFCMDAIRDVPTHGKKINRNRKNIPRRTFKLMKVTERRGKLHNKIFPKYFKQIFYIHNGPNNLFIYNHM